MRNLGFAYSNLREEGNTEEKVVLNSKKWLPLKKLEFSSTKKRKKNDFFSDFFV
jgi:hypothetical protein